MVETREVHKVEIRNLLSKIKDISAKSDRYEQDTISLQQQLSAAQKQKTESEGRLQTQIEQQQQHFKENIATLKDKLKSCEDCLAASNEQLRQCKADLTRHEQIARKAEKPKKVEQPVKIQQESKRASPWLPVKGPRKEVRELQGLW